MGCQLQGVYPPGTFDMLQLPKEWYNALEWQYPPHLVCAAVIPCLPCAIPCHTACMMMCSWLGLSVVLSVLRIRMLWPLSHSEQVLTLCSLSRDTLLTASHPLLQRQGSYEEEGRCVNTMKVGKALMCSPAILDETSCGS